MRIAILSCFPPYRGGIAQFNASLYRELALEHEVRAFNFKRQYPGILFPGKTQYVTDSDDTAGIESTAILDTVNPFSWYKTAKVIKEWQPDILLLRYWMPWFALPLGYVARRMNPDCKVIAVLDNVIPHERRMLDKPLTRYFLKGVDGCIAMCNEVAGDLRSICRDKPFIIHPHPIYDNFGEKIDRKEAEDMLGIPHGKKNLLFFGLIRDYKGLDILIDAFSRLDSQYELIIAGEPYGSFEKYRHQIDASPGRRRIHLFTDYIKDSDVRIYFSAADLCVLPYRSATQSGISAIAYHFEIPMVVTDTGGLKESIGDTGTGLVAKQPIPALIAHEIEFFFSDSPTRANCIQAIRNEKERLSWKRYAEALIEFARDLK